MGCEQSVAAPAATAPSAVPTYTIEEVAQHRTRDNLWVVVEGGVYHIPPYFLLQHPGGDGVILGLAGRDATRAFLSAHSAYAKTRLKAFLIGRLAPAEQQQVPAPSKVPSPPTYTMQQVASPHNSKDSTWVAVAGSVYDIPHNFLSQHPGGEGSILGLAGTDATEQFMAIHSEAAKQRLQEFCIGELQRESQAEQQARPGGKHPPEPALEPPPQQQLLALSPDEDTLLQLSQRLPLSPDTCILRFALPSPTHRAGVPCGMHVRVSARVGAADADATSRPYTPISSDHDVGRLDLLVKTYPAGTHPYHPAGGKMSQHLASLRVGDRLAFRGPLGRFVYEGGGAYTLLGKQGRVTHLSMVAAGTGITPLYAVLRAVLRDPADATCMSLLFANRCECDILLREQLDALAQAHPDKLKLRYVLSRPPDSWQYGSGHITQEMMAERLFPAGVETTLGLVCGPPQLLDSVCMPGFQAMGYKEEAVVRF